jgi:hypothetical protein
MNVVKAETVFHQMLLTIAGQESGFSARHQHGGGPARSLLQFELAGVRGVMAHSTSRDTLRALCGDVLVDFDDRAILTAMTWSDPFAFAMGRLLILTDPWPLPKMQGEGWALYMRTWRPGKPRREHWPVAWAQALAARASASKSIQPEVYH